MRNKKMHGDSIRLMNEYYRCSDRDIETDRDLHSPEKNGVCIQEDQLVLMARPIDMSSHLQHIINPEYIFQPGRCNAWFIHLMIGEPELVARFVPEYNKYKHYCYIRGSRRDGILHCGTVRKTIHYLKKINKKHI